MTTFNVNKDYICFFWNIFRTLLDLQNNQEDSTVGSYIFPHITHPVFPIIDNWLYYGMFIIINKPILIYYG